MKKLWTIKPNILLRLLGDILLLNTFYGDFNCAYWVTNINLCVYLVKLTIRIL